MVSRKETNRIIFHHSLSKDVDSETIKSWHLERGFDDIGYHFVIRYDGKIETGRDETMVGAHASGRNSDSIGVCLTGDFNKTEPTEFQLQSAKALYVSECRKYGKKLFSEFHRSGENACPGPKLDRQAFFYALDVAYYKYITDISEKERKEKTLKKWLFSKTLWVNALAVVGIVGQRISGADVLDPEAETAILAVVNMILRLVTNKKLIK